MALSWTMDKIGPLARSAEDCALVLQAIAGHDPRDPTSAPGTWTVRPGALDGRPLRLGILVHDYEARHAPEARARFRAALEVFHDLGHRSNEAALPDFPYGVAAQTIFMVESSAAFEDLIRSPRVGEMVDPVLQADLFAGLVIPGVDYLRAMRVRTLAGHAAVRVFERFDALIAPTLLQVAPPDRPDSGGGWARCGRKRWVWEPPGLAEHLHPHGPRPRRPAAGPRDHRRPLPGGDGAGPGHGLPGRDGLASPSTGSVKVPSSRQSFHHTHRWYIYDAAQLTLPDIDSLEVWPLGLTEAAFDRRAAWVSARERTFSGP